MVNWILTPVRNGLHLTQRAVQSFLNQSIGDVRVLLIDNSTKDGTKEWARTLYPKVVTIRREPPLGVAESWNHGLSILFDLTDHVLVCNNDIELLPDTYLHLLADGGGFVTGVSTRDRPEKIERANGKRPHPDFSCFLIKKGVWNKTGKFDSGFAGAYCEDLDYHLRMHQAGVEAYCIDVPFYHEGSGTLSNMTPAEVEALCKQADLNREYFEKKWGVKAGSPEYYALFTRSDGH